MLGGKKIAIVYDWIDKWGGVERVLLTLHEMFPDAQFYTSYYDQKKAGWAKDLNIKTSFIQKLQGFIRGSRIVSLPFYPYAFESFNFSEYDLVISVTSSFAKAIITRPETYHLCYLLTPTRYLWIRQDDYIQNSIVKNFLLPYLAKLRNWDFIAAQRPDKIISISKTVANRCNKYYQRKSDVIYPPFDVEYWNMIKSKIPSSLKLSGAGKNQKYFLAVSRLEPYKKVELMTQLINQLSHKLIIVGEGSYEQKLKRNANKNITFLKKVTDIELGYLYTNAEALIMPQEEDFGYVSLEAQFFGCPVIAYNRGGVTETVVEEKTGIFFDQQNPESIQAAIKRFFMVKYRLKKNSAKYGLENVVNFSEDKFRKSFLTSINTL